jgi:deoxyribodipyrimidine photo-lyase
MKKRAIVWFRQDLRISDNPALYNAALNYDIFPIYILDDEGAGHQRMGGASRWWLHHSLLSLEQSLLGKLNIYDGKAQKLLTQLVKRLNINAVFWNRCYEPWRIERDMSIKETLKGEGVKVFSFNGSLLWEPWEILKEDKSFYKVFTPFFKAALKHEGLIRDPLPKPLHLNLLKDQKSQNLSSLNLLPVVPWDKYIKKCWHVGEKAAMKKLLNFLDTGLLGYQKGRDYPASEHVSRLSPHLHFGEISPNQVWHKAQKIRSSSIRLDLDHFLTELGWREFSYYLLVHFPKLSHENFQKKFDAFPWHYDPLMLKAWQQGQTGYPLVDAGMRELWQTGYMHNRVRMVVASFLVKNLLLHWHEGEKWFWDCLLDADLANNSASWQWVAGSGADAAPYFRIFNPITQGEKFDKEGLYTRKFVPELSRLPSKYLFHPWEAPDLVLKQAGVVLGLNYPQPIVNLAFSREQALDAYTTLKSTTK